MKKIEQLELEELSIAEKQSISGGILPLLIVGTVVVGVATGYAVTRWWSRR